MPVISEVVHPLSLNFENQRKVILLRDVKKQSWDDVRKQVRNLKGKKPTVKLLRRVYKNFSKKKGRVVYKYKKCGRKPWKVTKGVESFLLRRLKALRCESICTTTVLQRELVNEKGVDLEASTIRKVLTRNGYFWLTRAQKRKYSPDVTAQRLAFAKAVLRMSKAQLRERLSLSLDGVVLSMAPKDPLERQNWCAHGDTHMWRKRCEAASPDLAGNDAYGKQVPLCFATVVFHKSKKLCTVEWADIVNGGKLTNAIRSLSPTKPRGPWWVLCDNETFLRTQVSQAAHKAQGISLWSVPPRSPDLNPVEKFWAWLRRTLRQKDWADLRAGRKALDKKAYQARVRSTCRTKRAQAVAASCAGGLRLCDGRLPQEQEALHCRVGGYRERRQAHKCHSQFVAYETTGALVGFVRQRDLPAHPSVASCAQGSGNFSLVGSTAVSRPEPRREILGLAAANFAAEGLG
ncbi:unnamed protein product [Polarella glacialis]|uniref:Tc1-like transposase DDE domain-containing protein n=1 Tax=Polarella glacialis TaxID=89957 RepID=A0A813DJH3_POLGL|nr:unnamed protein product [Polarella glacialis]